MDTFWALACSSTATLNGDSLGTPATARRGRANKISSQNGQTSVQEAYFLAVDHGTLTSKS